MSEYVEVIGVGAADAECDRVLMHIGASVRSDTVREAFAEAHAAMERIVASLRASGVSDLQSSDLDVRTDHESKRPGFRAGVGMKVVLDDVTSAGATVAAAVDAGGDASRVRGLRLSSSSTEQAYGLAREAAWRDAVAKAEHYAALAGRRLGRVLDISERGRDGGTPRMAFMAASAGSDVEGGSESVVVTVAVRWTLKD